MEPPLEFFSAQRRDNLAFNLPKKNERLVEDYGEKNVQTFIGSFSLAL